MSDLRQTYNQIAEDWHKDHQADDWWQAGTDKFIALVGQGARVLDVGCGGGTKSRYLLDHGLRVHGIDFSDKMIEICQQENPDGEFTMLDMRDVASLGQTYDGIFSQASLLHIPKKDVPSVITQLTKALRPGGYFYVAVKALSDSGIEEEEKVERDYGYSYARFFSYFSAAEIKQYFEQAKLTVVFEDAAKENSTWIQIIGQKDS